MNSFLRNLTASQQIGALFIVVFGVLSLATLWGFFRSLREHASDDPQAEAHAQEVKRFWGLIKTSWVMATVFWIGWALGDTVATVLFAIVGFFALREFITLSPTRRGDHRSLVLAFFVVLPLQFTIVGSRMFDLFTVFIPAFLVFFLVFVVQTCMLVQHLVGRRFPHKPVAPQVSQSFQWASWLAGVAAGGLAGGLLSFITPFKPGQALGMALLACFAGSLGHLVMKALKRDRGVTSWGMQGMSVTGAGGLLDRVDAPRFAAPVFFHSTRWYFGL